MPTLTSNYVNFFGSLIQRAPMSLLALLFLGALRVGPIVVMAPFFGARLPAPVKVGLILTITTVLLPHILLTSHTLVTFNAVYLGYMLKELLIGFVLSIFITVPFYIAQSAGSLIDFSRGSASLAVTDPSTQVQSSPLGLLYNFMMILLFYQLNGIFVLFDGVLRSYTFIPADAYIQPSFFSLHQPFWLTAMAIITKLIAIAVELAAPSLVALLMSNMFLGIANRLAPQVQIVFLGLSFNSLIGLGLLWAAWYLILKLMGNQALMWLFDMEKLYPTVPV